MKGNITTFVGDFGITYMTNSKINQLHISHDVDILISWFRENIILVSNRKKFMFCSLSPKMLPDIDIVFHSSKCDKLKPSNDICRNKELNVP